MIVNCGFNRRHPDGKPGFEYRNVSGVKIPNNLSATEIVEELQKHKPTEGEWFLIGWAPATKQEAYTQRQRAAGFVKVTVWVPDGAQPAVRSLASHLREAHNHDRRRETVSRQPRSGRGVEAGK